MVLPHGCRILQLLSGMEASQHVVGKRIKQLLQIEHLNQALVVSITPFQKHRFHPSIGAISLMSLYRVERCQLGRRCEALAQQLDVILNQGASLLQRSCGAHRHAAAVMDSISLSC